MPPRPPAAQRGLVHRRLDSGVEFAAEPLPERATVAICFRMLTGVVDDPPQLTGIGAIVARTLSKGTRRYDGRALADAFDALGARWSSASGRQSMIVRAVCLPQFALPVVDLVAEMLRHPTFPAQACRVAVELALQERRHLQDDPHDLLRMLTQRLTLGPLLGRHPGGQPATLRRVTRRAIVAHWRRRYHAGGLQVAVAGPLDADALARRIDQRLAGFGRPQAAPRPVEFEFRPRRLHRHKDLKQQYIAITLPGVPRDHPDFAAEQVLVGVLAGGMSGRLFTELRERRGLVYWVGAWHEEPRGKSIIHLGASTTPPRARATCQALLRELRRLGTDLSPAEVRRAREGLIAQYETESDLTRARAGELSEDLFHFSRPVGLLPKLERIRAVTAADVARFARRLPADRLCVATLGPRKL